MSIMCATIFTILHRVIGNEQLHAGSLVLNEGLHFVDQISGHHQDLLDIVMFCHFWGKIGKRTRCQVTVHNNNLKSQM